MQEFADYTRNCASAWTPLTHRRLSTLQARPLLDCCAPVVPAERPPAQCRQVQSRLVTCTAAQLQSASAISAVYVAAQVAQRDHRLSPAVQQPRRKGLYLHIRALRHVRSLRTDRRHPDCMDYCNGLLRGAPAATFDKLQRVYNNQSSQSHLQEWWPHRRQTTSPSLAASETAGHIQSVCDDVQGPSQSHTSVTERLDPEPSTISVTVFI